MKIQENNNYINFNGLNLAKTSDFHLKKYIIPCMPELKNLAQKADIYIGSRWDPCLQAGILEYALQPLGKANDDVLRWDIIFTGYNNHSVNTVINKISNAIKNLK